MNRANLCAVTFFCFTCIPTTASAAIIGRSVSGPGGTGTTVLTSAPNYLWVRTTFTAVDYMDISITVDSPGNYFILQDRDNAFIMSPIHNETDVQWSGFDISSLFPDDSQIVSIFATEFQTIVNDGDSGHLSNALINDGSEFELSLKITATAPGTITIREIPIVVPEVSTLTMMSLFSVGAFGLYRRRRNG